MQTRCEKCLKKWSYCKCANNLPQQPSASEGESVRCTVGLERLAESWERRVKEWDIKSPFDTYNNHDVAREVEECLRELRAEMEKLSNEKLNDTPCNPN